MIVILLFAFLMTVAFSIDIAHMHLARAELRTATDAAAKAAATTLADSLNRDAAIARGQEIAVANRVGGEPLLLSDADFAFGRSERQNNGKYVFGTGDGPLNSVRVNGRRTADSLSGPVPLLFGNVTGTHVFQPQLNATATYVERDIVLVVDRSGSMFGQKFLELVAAIGIFSDMLRNTPVEEQVALASYNNRATEDLELTDDLTALIDTLTALRVGGLTSISRGMSAGRQLISRGRPPEFVERTMIVMTDGRHNRGPEPRTVARQLARQNVTIHAITFGGGADRARMTEVATIGNGRYYHADNGEELREVYREIALTLGTIITD